MVLQNPNPPPNLVGVAFVVLQDVFVVDWALHMLRLGRKEGFGRRFLESSGAPHMLNGGSLEAKESMTRHGNVG